MNSLFFTFGITKRDIMKRIPQMLSIALVCIGMAACQEAQVDQAALDLKVQEKSAVLIEKANEEYAANCEARITTELKAKTDSILAARKAAAGAQ